MKKLLFVLLLAVLFLGGCEKELDDSYTVTWKNYDGTVLEIDTDVSYGTMPVYDGETPIKTQETFKGWNPVLSIVTNDVIYTAQFEPNVITYTITWKNYDGTVLEIDTDVSYGTMPVYDGEIPTKPNETFIGWDKEIEAVTNDTIFNAKFEVLTIEYTVTFNGNGGSLISGTEIQTVQEGYAATPPTYEKEGYSFKEWDISFNNIVSNITINAVWEKNDYLIYTLDSEKNSYCVTGTNDLSIEEVVIRSEYNGLPVTSISERAFHNYKDLKVIDIPNSITSIGEYAFSGCSSLESIIIPDNVINIGFASFSGCTSLTKITLPFVGKYNGFLFNDVHFGYIFGANNYEELNHVPNSLKEVVITRATNIGCGAFSGCTSLTTITILEGLINIELFAFEGCTNLTNISIPDSVNYIGLNAFKRCDNLQYNTYDNGLYLGNIINPYVLLLKVVNTSITSCIIHDDTKIIFYAFTDCINLNTITIPDKVVNIGSYAFSGCTNLTSVTMPNSVTNIGLYAFSKCINLSDIIIPDNVIYIGSYAFDNCKSIESITIPDSVTIIEPYAFIQCTGLTSITISNNLEMIKDSTFLGCTSLESVIIPDSVTNIEFLAFNGCKKLINVVIPNSVTKIEANAFSDCTSLESVILPESITNIGDYAFRGCPNLQFNTYDNGLYLGNATNPFVTLIRSINTTITSCIIHDDTKVISSSAFRECKNLLNIIIPNKVTNIGNHAFSGCINLSNVTLPNNVTNIEAYAFNECGSLTNITIPDSIMSIGNFIFNNCINLKYNTYDNGLYLGNQTNPYLVLMKVIDVTVTEYLIHEDTKVICPIALRECTNLVNITIPDSIASIDANTFSGCTNLESIVIPNSITRIKSYVFSRCPSLTSVIIPNSVTYIESNAFNNCKNLTTIIIPDSVTDIEKYAFYECVNLTIYCEVESKPSRWNNDWNFLNIKVVWNYEAKD